jgi:hypothetical protein
MPRPITARHARRPASRPRRPDGARVVIATADAGLRPAGANPASTMAGTASTIAAAGNVAASGDVWPHSSRRMKMSKDWLSRIAADTRINVLAVPGTHDAASISGASSMPLTITQQIDITHQLDAGVRVLDMRVAHVAASTTGGWIRTKKEVPEDIYMCHGPIVFATRLSEALDSIKKWLAANDTEFVALIFQQQGTKPKEAAEKRRVVGLIQTAITSAFSDEWIFGPGHCGNDWPTVGELKRKVMIFSRLEEDVPNAFDLRAWNTASLADMISARYDVPGTGLKVAIQDRYTKVTNTDFTDHLNRGRFNDISEINKAKFILFEKMHSQFNDRRTLKINHLSHSLKSPTYPQPYMLGTDINKRLTASIMDNKNRRYRGFVMIDDAEASVCKRIIDSNVVFQTDSR